jgi:hypothetical protein
MMRRCLPWLLLGVLAAGAAFGAGIGAAVAPENEGSNANSTSPAPADDSPGVKVALTSCTASQLSVMLGQNLAGAGNEALVILFENVGSSTCLLRGYPTVVGLDASGNWVGVSRHAPVDGGGAVKARSFELRPNQRGSSLLQTVGVQLNGAICVTYQAILVQTPNTIAYFRVRLKWPLGEGPLTDGLSVCGTVFVDPVTFF